MKSADSKRGCRSQFSIILLSLLICLPVGHAQVVRDNSLDNHRLESLSGPNFNITADYGRTVGNNLFHSFSQFDLVKGDVATFYGPGTPIQNVLTRITGANASSINGTIRTDPSTLNGANLFFLNPHGVVFGQNAQVDVKGSFVVTSAHYIELSDGHRFDTVNPSANDPLLTTAPPRAFGFLGPNVASISFNGSMLSVPNQKSLSVIGGDIQIVNGTLTAAGGRINLISLGSAGTLSLAVDDLGAAVDTSSFSKLGTVSLTGGSALMGDDGMSVGGGKVVVQAENLNFDSSGIQSDTLGSENGLGVEIRVRNDMTLQNMGYVFSDTGGSSTGNGGTIDIQAHQFELLSGSAITCDVHGPGTGGNISLTVDSVVLDGMPNPHFFAGIGARTASSGNAGNIVIGTDALDIRNGMIVSGVTAGSGDGANMTVSASAIHIDGHGKTSGIIADATDGGNAGNISVTTGSLEISNGGRISAATSGIGNGGSVTVTATDSILLDGEGGILFTGLGVPPLAGATGKGGDLVIETGQLEILNGARILASTEGSGVGGNINITATDIVLDGGETPEFFTGVEAGTSGSGNGGGITINTGSLRMVNGSQINVDTSDTGAPAGNIDITAGSIDIRSSSEISASTDGLGQGGRIMVAADSITLDGQRADGTPGHAGMFAGNFFGVTGNAPAGDIVIKPGTSGGLALQLLNGAEISTSAKGASDGGSIFIDATTMTLNNHASVQCSTVGSGEGGNVSIGVNVPPVLLELADHSSIDVTSPRNGGNITLAIGSLVYMLDSTLSASAGDNGGNIRIDPEFLVMNRSSIVADAVNNNGGNIDILADFFLSSDSPIHADSQFGNPGTVLIETTELDLSGSLLALPSSLLGAESQLRERCGVRLAGGISSFLVLGRGGAPIIPDRPLPAFGPQAVGGGAN